MKLRILIFLGVPMWGPASIPSENIKYVEHGIGLVVLGLRAGIQIRGKAPAVFLAQSEGLGWDRKVKQRANGPAVMSLARSSRNMPQSHAQVWLHFIYSTKNRKEYLKQPAFRDQMFRMLAHHVNAVDCVAAKVGGHFDHVHLLVGLSRTIKIGMLIEQVKTETSKWAKQAEGGHGGFAWQAGYGVFSVSYSNLSDVERYVSNQEQHHARRSYQDEFRLLCEKHGIEIDERFAWD